MSPLLSVTRRRASIAGSLLLAVAVPWSMHAQPGGRGSPDRIPPGAWPARGECRVWYDGRPPGRQPAPSSCARARELAFRTGGRVIYGDARPRGDDWWGRGRDRDCDDWRGRRDRRDDCDWRDRDRDRRRDCDDRRGRRDRRDDCRWGRRYPASLPDLIWAVIWGRGGRVTDARRWLGDGRYRPRWEQGRGRGPDVVVWLDERGRTHQRWIDTDRDGRADRVELFADGRRLDVIDGRDDD